MDVNEFLEGLLKSIAGIEQSMETPFEDRVVGRHENELTGLCVSTMEVFDSDRSFETAIAHPDFAQGKWVVVEGYDDIDTAAKGHDKWLAVMTAEKLPGALVDVSTSFPAKMSRELGDPLIFEKGIECEKSRNETK